MAKARKHSTALSWITSEAKRLRRKDNDRRTWKQYVAQASAIYAKKHKGKSPVGRKHKVSGQVTKSKSHTDKNKFRNVDISIGAISHHITVARHALEGKLKDEWLKHYNAPTKTAKKKHAKKIAELKSKIQKLK